MVRWVSHALRLVYDIRPRLDALLVRWAPPPESLALRLMSHASSRLMTLYLRIDYDIRLRLDALRNPYAMRLGNQVFNVHPSVTDDHMQFYVDMIYGWLQLGERVFLVATDERLENRLLQRYTGVTLRVDVSKSHIIDLLDQQKRLLIFSRTGDELLDREMAAKLAKTYAAPLTIVCGDLNNDHSVVVNSVREILYGNERKNCVLHYRQNERHWTPF